MQFSLHSPAKEHLKAFDTKFALQQDNWNDYSFQTLYHLYYNNGLEGEVTFIGSIKILKRGQTQKDPLLITQSFDSLGSEFCSVGTTLDYYQRLNVLPEHDRKIIVKSLGDVVANPELVEIFSSEYGWETSLFRDNRSWRDFLADASALFTENFSTLPELNVRFSFKPSEYSKPIEFNFSAPEPPFYYGPYRIIGPSKKKVLLPQRLIVLIGRNGSGKSTLLSRIAHVAFASPQERKEIDLLRLGSFDPEAIGFMRIITISYSAFDSFTVPGSREKDFQQITIDIAKGEGRFVYCGLRDVVGEARDDLKAFGAKHQQFDGHNFSLDDRRTTTKLKSINELAEEYGRLINRIETSGKRQLFEYALQPLLNDPSFADITNQNDDDRFMSNARENFLTWSTGHKVALHVLSSLVANATRKSLVLFDEPEMHLHPPLVAALIQSVRIVLEEINAFCIIATHSPVLLQETLAQHVRIINRIADQIEVRVPELETFGENIGVLTYDTFGLTASSTDFHKTLDNLVQGSNSLEEIEEFFPRGLSGQARAYVISCLASKGALK